MTDEQQISGTPGKVSGNMFLYKEPELLAPETHGSMGFTPSKRPYDFAKDERAIPLTMVEFSGALHNYPIIFSNIENPLPLAIVGIEETNLFVGSDGNWAANSYVPTYLRCYPFAIAMGSDGQAAVVVDKQADSVSEDPMYPFFEGENVSEHAEALMRLCAQYDTERRKTVEFCARLRDLGLLTPLRATYTPPGKTEPAPLAEYIGIDTDRLNDLSKDEVYDLHNSGFLAAIYLQLYSLENWNRLMVLQERVMAA